MPSVAIATALMPPLCTAGYGLARHRLDYFGGALYLFFINSFFICLAAIVVLKLLRLPHGNDISPKALKKIHRNIAFITVITMLPSIYLGYDIVKKTMDNSSAEKFITENFDFDGDGRLHRSRKRTVVRRKIRHGLQPKKPLHFVAKLPQ